MDYYYTRIQEDIQRSRIYAEDRQSEIRRSRRVQQVLQSQEDLRRLATGQKLRADRQYEEYLIRRQTQQRQLQAQIQREKSIRQQQLREQQTSLQAERRFRIVRQEQVQRRRIVHNLEEKQRFEHLAASRKIQLQARIRIQDEATREAILVKEQQLEQQRLQAQLRQTDVQIGTIYDKRQARRKSQLQELQVLDQKIFKVRQQMRGSKIRQTALQDSLNNLSKIIVPGAR